MSHDRRRLVYLLERLRELELRIPPNHERAILEVARAAVAEEIRNVSRRLRARDSWLPHGRARAG